MPLRSILDLPTRAPHMGVVFDCNGTLLPDTGVLFFRETWRRDWRCLFDGTVGFPAGVAFSNSRTQAAVLLLLEQGRQRPKVAELFRRFADRPIGPDLFPRAAQEWAWRRANLQAVIIASGGFELFTKPVVNHLNPLAVVVNDRFHPRAVTPDSKPEHVAGLLHRHRLRAFAAYTNAFEDRHLLTTLSWDEKNVVAPDDKLRRLARNEGWTVLEPDPMATHHPLPVTEYASHVLLSDQSDKARIVFYQSWVDTMRASIQQIVEPVLQLSLVAVAGLYLTESEPTRLGLSGALGGDFDGLCFDLYHRWLQEPGRAEILTPLGEI